MPVVTMKSLLESGVHFGHQTRRWNPKMKPYIFTERNGIYIIDLQRTLRELDAAFRFVRTTTSHGGEVLFIGTKKQAAEPIIREATRCGMPYVTQRWLGGMLTNFATIRGRINRMKELEQMDEDGSMKQLPKKEQLKLHTELGKLQKNLNGIRDMTAVPAAVFVIDTKREEIAVAEARRLGIPVVALVDTNADPDEIDYVIPGNDDAMRAVNLMTKVIADAVLEGRAKLEGPQVVVEPEPRPEPKVLSDEDAAAAIEAEVQSGEAVELGKEPEAVVVAEAVIEAEEVVDADNAAEAAKADKAPEATKADEAPEAAKADEAPEEPAADAPAAE
jgi:small subunit ribosomal protein S2